MNNLTTIHKQVKKELTDCADFWLKNGWDKTNGGVYTCLDTQGQVYSTDKSVWMQGRCGWTFSHLCNAYGTNPDWQAFAKSCLEFAHTHCVNREAGNRMYFTVTATGAPLRQRRYCFSEGFYALGNAEYYVLTHEQQYLARAREAWEMIWRLNNALCKDPTGLGAKTISATRQGRSLADSMIYLNLCMVLCNADQTHAQEYLARAKQCAETILSLHHKPELKATLETVGMHGEFLSDTTAGRVVNPGHDMECAWFLLEYAQKANDKTLEQAAIQMFDFAYQNGWDEQYGGLLYYTDVLGRPPEAYEHDMKLWWPHNELLIASLMIYQLTGEVQYRDIFTKTWNYCMQVFKHGTSAEWYGYLRRDGKPTLPAAKGSTFKGPFHLPRMLMLVDDMLEKM